MVDERKIELRRLLEEVMQGLKIGFRLSNSSFLLPPNIVERTSTFEVFAGRHSSPIREKDLQAYLEKRWKSYGTDDATALSEIEFYIAVEETKLQVIEFIREELAPFLDEDNRNSTVYTNYIISDDDGVGYRLHSVKGGHTSINQILDQLLRIAIAKDIDNAVDTFHKGSNFKGKQSVFYHIVALKGITVDMEIDVCDGVRLVPFPLPMGFELEELLPSYSSNGIGGMRSELGDSLLVFERPVYSIFFKPGTNSIDNLEHQLVSELPNQIGTDNISFSSGEEVTSFVDTFCHALSLACNSGVKNAGGWYYFPEDEMPVLFLSGGRSYRIGPFSRSVKVSQEEIVQAYSYYEIFRNLETNTVDKLRIPIERLIESYTRQNAEDKLIDLGIAFESLYLPNDNTDQLSFQFRLRASKYLGKDLENRKRLLAELKLIYEQRSKAVHNGNIPDRIKIGKGQEPIAKSDLILKAQNLCRVSILKILDEGNFPDWNDIILG